MHILNSVSQTFTDNITRTFGERGVSWLNKLDSTIERCVGQWNLRNCLPVGNLSFNMVCTADSPIYGSVILKIGVSSREILQEYKTLQLLSGKDLCACLEFDSEKNALLLRRISPGYDLFSLKNTEQQIEVGCRIIHNLPGPTEGCEGFPHYRDWIQRAFSRVGDSLLPYTEKAGFYFSEIEDLNIPDKLLHGDYHHMNILMNENKEWILIDPKGVIGKHPMESGRFILNQLAVLPPKDHSYYLNFMFDSFAEALNTDRDVIYKCAYTEYVLSCCWTLEGTLTSKDREKTLDDLKYTTELYRTISNKGTK